MGRLDEQTAIAFSAVEPFGQVCLPEPMAELCTLVRSMAHRKGLTLELATQGTALARIESDPARIRQILLKLFGNAIKCTPADKVSLAADWKADTVVLSVQDSGIFVQVDSSTTRLYGGTGLGLAISRRLVEAVGGTIGCTSRVGGGDGASIGGPSRPGG